MALLGFLTIAVFLYLILSKRVSVIVALILVPFLFALIGGFGVEIGPMALAGIEEVAPTGVMLGFAILFFGIMNQAGLFDPLITRILKMVQGDPLKIVMGTVVIAMLTHLDGSGASTFLITIPALLPLYDRVGMSRLVLAGMVALGAGTMNMIPWGGPTVRAASSLGLEVNAIFTPLIPAMVAGIGWILFVSYLIGKRERKRVGIHDFEYDFKQELSAEEMASRRPKLFWLNLVLTIVTVVALVKAWLPLPIIFMVALAVALLVNYPDPKEQQARLRAQATGMVTVVSIIFAAGIFSGILSGTGMIDAMAQSLVAVVPQQTGGWMALLVAVTSMPLSLIFTPDAYYFGVLPVLAQTAGVYGIESVEVARAAILGQMTTGFPPQSVDCCYVFTDWIGGSGVG
ncbi:CitMHS family citrate-Mg2+:H+ or citrate-Ca2+:H+ symporter [Desmospora activa DSM 45169]|uniref:CitMHS family citrate-Mg2+:H+ or citrate-Ca2+:H+ symporter n=1 Tax=Desmospora activa DSM 45169 TaxID=1121389 RepID=A0A2T4Z9A7_9BACL|nr:CitMHS family citrate-Mg2+:H+ or citrate-Ca2+:H+ symporter [Desmospora activa DSM 45169]